MRTFRQILWIVFMVLAVTAATADAADLQPENKRKFEQLMIGDWAVPENKYLNVITFSLTPERTFTCSFEEPKKDPVEWSGHWKVRTTKSGVRAFLKGQNTADPNIWMKAVIRSNEEMDIFAILITWDFKGEGRTWQSALEKQEAASEEGEQSGEDTELEEEEQEQEGTEEEAPEEEWEEEAPEEEGGESD